MEHRIERVFNGRARHLALAALILAGESGVGDHPPLLLRIAGQTLLERQVRQAHYFGAVHIVLLVSALPAAILAIIDRMKAEGISVDLARDAHDAADRFHPEEDILIFDGAIIIENQNIETVIQNKGSALITIKSDSAGPRFERIDADDCWAGIAKIDGGVLRETSAMLGDWVLGPTLLRRAVQQGAMRIALSQPTLGMLIRPQSQTEANDVGRSLVQAVHPTISGWFDRICLVPLSRALAPIAVKRNIKHSVLEISSISLYLLSIISIFVAPQPWPYVLYLLALIPAALAEVVRRITISGSIRFAKILQMRSAMLAAIVLVSAIMTPAGKYFMMGVVLALWFSVQWMQGKYLLAPATKVTSLWHSDAGALALILLVFGSAGHSFVGLGLCIVLMVAEPLWHMNKRLLP
ncbi:MAG: hypothetical protein ABL918_08275 [Chakrabartia sp.]